MAAKSYKGTSYRRQSLKPGIVFLLLALLFLFLVLITFNHLQPGTYIDDAHYIALARSLATGSSYGYLNFPATADVAPLFPIGFPLALAPLVALFPQALWPLQLAALLATLANGLLLYRFWPLWTRSSPWWGVGITAAYWLLPLVVEQARMIMSEALFLTIYLLLVAVVAQYQSGKLSGWYLLAILALAVALIATRTIGIAIVAGVGVSFLFTRRYYRTWRQFAGMVASLAAGTILIGLLLFNSNSLLPQRYWQNSDAKYFRAFLPAAAGTAVAEDRQQAETSASVMDWQRFGRKLRHHLYEDIPDSILPGTAALTQRLDQQMPLPLLQPALGLVVIGLLLLGGMRWIKQVGRHVLWISALAYAAALLFWNWNSPRLLYAIIPHLVYAFYLGCQAISRQLFGARRSRSLLLALVVLLLVFFVVITLRRSPSVDHVGDLSRRTAWLRINASPVQVVMAEYPVVDHLYAKTQTVYLPQVQTAAELNAYLLAHDVDYLLLAPEIAWDTPRYEPNWSKRLLEVQPLVDELEERSQIVLSFASDAENLRIYQVLK